MGLWILTFILQSPDPATGAVGMQKSPVGQDVGSFATSPTMKPQPTTSQQQPQQQQKDQSMSTMPYFPMMMPTGSYGMLMQYSHWGLTYFFNSG